MYGWMDGSPGVMVKYLRGKDHLKMSGIRDEGAVKMVETGGGGEKKVRRSNADNSNRWEVGVREGRGSMRRDGSRLRT